MASSLIRRPFSAPDFHCFQYQLRRRKTWKFLSHAVMSGRQEVECKGPDKGPYMLSLGLGLLPLYLHTGSNQLMNNSRWLDGQTCPTKKVVANTVHPNNQHWRYSSLVLVNHSHSGRSQLGDIN